MGQRHPNYGTNGSYLSDKGIFIYGTTGSYLWDKGILFMGQRDPIYVNIKHQNSANVLDFLMSQMH